MAAGDDPDAAMDRLADGEWLKAMKVHQVNVTLPKFKFSAEFSLKDVLSEMGMPLAFSKRADFSGMTTREMAVRHDHPCYFPCLLFRRGLR